MAFILAVLVVGGLIVAALSNPGGALKLIGGLLVLFVVGLVGMGLLLLLSLWIVN